MVLHRAARVSDSLLDAQRSFLAHEATVTALRGGISPEQFGARMQHPAELLQVLQSLCSHAVTSLPVVQAAGITVQFRGAPFTVAQTASWVQIFEEQHTRAATGPACGRCKPNGW